MNKLTRTWQINGALRSLTFSPSERLLDVLRERAGLMSIKEGCGEGECGACTVIIDGETQLACLILAAQIEDGAQIFTTEGLAATELGRRLQKSFDERGAVQCGFCTPGMLLSSYALLSKNAQPSIEEIKQGLAGNLCRCTGYTKIIEAVTAVAPGGAK